MYLGASVLQSTTVVVFGVVPRSTLYLGASVLQSTLTTVVVLGVVPVMYLGALVLQSTLTTVVVLGVVPLETQSTLFWAVVNEHCIVFELGAKWGAALHFNRGPLELGTDLLSPRGRTSTTWCCPWCRYDNGELDCGWWRKIIWILELQSFQTGSFNSQEHLGHKSFGA